jgi:GDP-D-mannose dehydratase
MGPTWRTCFQRTPYSVRRFIEWTASELGMQIRWAGEGVSAE